MFFDPGADLGWAVASADRGVYAAGRLVKGWDAVLALRLLQGFTLRVSLGEPPIVIVEDQYVGNNAQSAMAVVESRMRIEVPAQLLYPQIPHVLRVLSTSWQADMLQDIGKRTRDSLKAAAMRSAKKIVADLRQPQALTEDEADAVCGAHWVGSVVFGWAIP